MAEIIKLARYLIYSYEHFANSQFESSELKLQKLMYLIQRESFALTGKPLFENSFEGWKHGPVLPELRFFFEDGYQPYEEKNGLTDKEKYIIDNVVEQYGKFEAWALREMSHKEISWLKSREGISEGENGNNKLSLEDIKKDSEKVRLYDHQYGMYIDEFEEFDDEVLC